MGSIAFGAKQPARGPGSARILATGEPRLGSCHRSNGSSPPNQEDLQCLRPMLPPKLSRIPCAAVRGARPPASRLPWPFNGRQLLSSLVTSAVRTSPSEWLDPRGLLPYERNPRTHSKKQIEQIAASIREFGFTNPVLSDGERRIIAGHGRVAAAKLLGMDRVPTIRLEHLSEAQKRAYIIADNRLAELAGWDEALLAIELKDLIEIDFSVELTGFATAEIDLVIGRQEQHAEPHPP